jgi:hypothetical protein
MKKFNMYLLIADGPHEVIKAENEQEAMEKFFDDSLIDEFVKHAGFDCKWKVVAEEIEDEDDEEEDECE